MISNVKTSLCRYAGWFCFIGLVLFAVNVTNAAEIQASKARLVVSDLDSKQLKYLSKLKQKQLDQVVTVAVLDEQGQLLGQVWGSVLFNNEVLQFLPRFPFDDNQQYFARFQVGKDNIADLLSKRFAFVAEQNSVTIVTDVFPSANVLPENLFKFYIQFSHPMSRGEAYQHIQLLDDQENPVELPFLELSQELWDPNGRRFTLLFDPGRTKQGIKPNRDMGLPLSEGKQFTLVIDQQWQDAKGLPLQKPFKKQFTVGPQDHQQPNMDNWVISVPDGGSRNPVTVTFDEPLDRAQLENALWIEAEAGRLITGEVSIGKEMVWQFVPTYGWRSGNYRLVANSYLEDRAANSLGRPFEVIRTDDEAYIPPTFSKEFIIKAID